MNTGLITINLLIVNTGPSGSLFITKLSTWHICQPQSLDFLRRLMVIMEPKSFPWAWTKFPKIPLRFITGQPWSLRYPRPLANYSILESIHSDIYVVDSTFSIRRQKNRAYKNSRRLLWNAAKIIHCFFKKFIMLMKVVISSKSWIE